MSQKPASRLIGRPIRRLYVANRGEIAVRVIQACRKLGIESVVGVSAADRESAAARLADRVLCIGPAAARDSYLRIPTVIEAAMGSGCDAIHPGYGFLAERPELVEACQQNDLVFVGPSAAVMRAAGDKIRARQHARDAGVPLAAGSDEIETPEQARMFAEQIGYPVLLKASAGGGGRGMRIARDPAALHDSFEQAASEALEAFGDGRLFMERYIEHARHIEVQVLGDQHGNLVHLFERDCSAQRRHQKIIEEAPAPDLPADVRGRLLEAALAFARSIGYFSAGTVEFLYDAGRRDFFFLEMNTRIQVEHPVTESVTGIDLVAEQIRVAQGEALAFSQADIGCTGHAIECRLNVEDPLRDFMPVPGRIKSWDMPDGEGIRIDTHGYAGYLVPPYYDSLLAKLICTGTDRASAIERSRTALAQMQVEGVCTNQSFQRFMLDHADFAEAKLYTRWIEETGMPQFLDAQRSST